MSIKGPFRFTWNDAFCAEDAWVDRESFTYEKRPMETVGWVVLQDRDYLAVAGTYDEAAGLFCNVILIPRGCIVDTRDVSELVGPVDDSDLADSGSELPAARWKLP